MSLDVRRKAFDPFFTTRRDQGGTGLGLHIVHTIVTNCLGGRLNLDSVPGKGTRFSARPAASCAGRIWRSIVRCSGGGSDHRINLADAIIRWAQLALFDTHTTGVRRNLNGQFRRVLPQRGYPLSPWTKSGSEWRIRHVSCPAAEVPVVTARWSDALTVECRPSYRIAVADKPPAFLCNYGAYRSINWKSLVLIVGMLPISPRESRRLAERGPPEIGSREMSSIVTFFCWI